MAQPATPPASTGIVNPHGPLGFFGDLRIDGLTTNAMPLPSGGILNFLPRSNGSWPNNLTYSIITGVTQPAIEAATDDCCDPPSHRTGLTQLCTQVSKFGRMEIMDKGVALRCYEPPNPCESLDVRIIGNPLTQSQNSGLIAPPLTDSNNVNSAGIKRMFELYVSLIRYMAPEVWSADGEDTGDMSWCPPEGIDSLINDNHVDAINGTACPAANSYILDANNADICTQEGVDLVYRLILDMYHTLWYRARAYGLAPAVWLPTMHPTLFRMITRFWPLSMLNVGCMVRPDTSQSVRFTLDDPIAQAQEMFEGNYLWIDGVRVPILTDDSVPRTFNGTAVTSSIWWVPYTVQGGTPVTIVDYARWDRAFELGDPIMQRVLQAHNARIVDDGRWLWLENPLANGCGGEYILSCRPRILFMCPQLAGKILNIVFTPDYSHPEWDVNNPNYLGGGNTSQPAA